MAGRVVREEMRKAGFTAGIILSNVRKLRRLVESLDWQASADGWSEYRTLSHVGRDRSAKGEYLREVTERVQPGRVLDLGANDGHFSDIVVQRGAHAIAVDGDESVLDLLYRQSSGKEISVVLSDVANPSPSQGWAGVERPGLFDRARPDLVVAYGLIHHLIYTSSIPPVTVMEWLRGFHCPVVVEYVSPEDEMVARLTANKLAEELHPGGDETSFRKTLGGLFEVRSERKLASGTRILFELVPR
jgi:hypothetical protein